MLHGREFYLLYYKVPFFRNSRTESNHSYNGLGWCKMEIKQRNVLIKTRSVRITDWVFKLSQTRGLHYAV